MKWAGGRTSTRFLRFSAQLFRGAIALCLAGVLGVTGVQARLVPCNGKPDGRQVVSALAHIRRSVDPCGESAQVIAVLETLQRCSKTTYQICTNPQISRNVFDRPSGEHGETAPRTITWNPVLRSELERGCGADAAKPVLRDPTASLLHELVHAAHDCQGLNPGEHEIEAVRIENIYRRAAGLCQRNGYGEDPLPAQVVKDCVPGHCLCAASGNSGELVRDQETPLLHHSGDRTSPVEGRFGDTGVIDRINSAAQRPGTRE